MITPGSNTLHSRDRLVKPFTDRGELSDVLNHAFKAGRSFIGEPVQSVQRGVNLLCGHSCRISDSFDRADLCTVLLETSRNRCNGELIDRILKTMNSLFGHLKQCRDLGYFSELTKQVFATFAKKGEVLSQTGNSSVHVFKSFIVFSEEFELFIDHVKTLANAFKVKRLFQIVDCLHTGLNVFLELFVVKLHRDNTFVHVASHQVMTSFHTSSAILSKIG